MYLLNRSKNQSSGFTLMELLIVISIIAVLASLLLTVISGVQQKNNSVRCASNLRQIGVAMNLYANDHNNLYPPLVDENKVDWDSKAIDPYLPMRSDKRQSVLFICPTANYKGQNHSDLLRTYSATECMVGPDGDLNTGANPKQFASAAGTLVLFDAPQTGDKPYAQEEVTWQNIQGAPELGANSTSSTYISFRHQDSFNGLFADGRVSKVTRKETPTFITEKMWKGREVQTGN